MNKADGAGDVLAERRGPVKWVWLNRPDVKNAITLDLADRLREEIESAPAEGARVVVLSGTGDSFCAGADLKAMAQLFGQEISVKELLAAHYHKLMMAISRLPLPVIAAVDGAAAGMGCDLALAADLRVVSKRAFFAEIFVNIGLMPDGGGSYHLPRLVGLGRALEMALLGRRVSAEEAERWGMANLLVPVETFAADVQQFAEHFSEKAPLAQARAKAAIRAHAAGGSLAEALLHEAEMQQELCETEDFAEGVMAFIQKRKPNFQGR